MERCALTDGLLYFHICLNLIKRHMSRSLNHNLNVLFPCTFGQLAKTYKLLDLAYVCCVSQTSRTAGITKGDGHIILAADIQDLVVVFIERILLTESAGNLTTGRSNPG